MPASFSAGFLLTLFSVFKMAHATRLHSFAIAKSSLYCNNGSQRCAFSSIQTWQTNVKTRQIQSHQINSANDNMIPIQVQAKFIPESKWRDEAASHKSRMTSLLAPGLTQPRDNDGSKRGRSLDPRHPIYNFLVEYYGIKESKGVNRLMRWCPAPFYCHELNADDEIVQLNVKYPIDFNGDTASTLKPSPSLAGVFLENATMDDVNSGILNLRGATFINKHDNTSNIRGILYSPHLYLGRKDIDIVLTGSSVNRIPHRAAAAFLWYRTLLRNTLQSDPILYCHGMHEWAMLYNPDTSSPPPPSSKYQSHLSLRISQQVINEQVERKGIRCTHIDALRFFAPEARKWNWYGSLDDLTKDERGVGVVAKQNVERHLQSSSSFENSQQPYASAILTRTDQLHLEQKACLHANMDLFKIAWRIQPFLSSNLLAEALAVALQARTLDVEASPYDVSNYIGLRWGDNSEDHVGMPCGTIALNAVKIETEDGRKEYQQRQAKVMKRGQVVREKLLSAYNDFLLGVFGIDSEKTVELYKDKVATQSLRGIN